MKKILSIPLLLIILLSAGCMNKFEMAGKIGALTLPENELTLKQKTVFFNNRKIEEVVSKARIIKSGDPKYNNIKIISMSGTPYEMGFQNGYLNKKDIQKNIYHIIGIVKFYAKHYGVDESALDEVYDLIDPYIPIEDKEEMRGLAHGSEVPLRLIHWLHSIPELSEYAGKKQFLRDKQYEKIKPEKGSLADPKLETCSGVITFGEATKNCHLYHLRVLDWIRELGAQKYPVINVYQPEKRQSYASFSYAGFIGCFTGMNEHISMGEMGYGNRNFETLEGVPFVFLYKIIAREANNIQEAMAIVKNVKRTCSYVYQFSGATVIPEKKAVMLVSDYNRYEYLYDNMNFTDEGDDTEYEGLNDIIFAGHETDKLRRFLSDNQGSIDLNKIKDLAKIAAMRGNVQNVIMSPETGEAWMTNAKSSDKSEEGKACNQAWFYFNFKKLISQN